MSVLQRVAPGIDLTPVRRTAMSYICRKPFCRVEQLAHEIGLSTGGALGVCHKLQRAGLVYEPALDAYALTREGCKVLASVRSLK